MKHTELKNHQVKNISKHVHTVHKNNPLSITDIKFQDESSHAAKTDLSLKMENICLKFCFTQM